MSGILGTIFQWLGYTIFNATPPVATDGSNVPLQSDVNGNLLVSLGGTGGSGGSGTNATQIQSINVDATAPTTNGQVLAYNATANTWGAPRLLTLDDLGPAFTPTLALASGGAGPFVPGATWTPTFTSSPAPNAGGISTPLKSDNQGHTNVAIVGGNPISPPTVSSYTLTAAGTVNVNVTLTQGGVTKTTNNVSGVFAERTFQGVGGAGATGSTASGTNAALSGGSSGGTTLTGTASMPTPSGQSFNASPAGQKVYDQVLHTTNGYSYFDVTNNAPFAMLARTTITFVNENGISESWDLYESQNTLSSTYTIKRTAL